MLKENTKIKKICEYCGKEYYVKRYREKTSRFCSNNCLNEWQRGRKIGEWIEQDCLSCGKKFSCLKSKPKKYCSEKCNKERLDTKEKVVCCFCNKEFYIRKGRYNKIKIGKQKDIYCSKECSWKAKCTGGIKKCPVCGHQFYVNGYRFKKENVCCSVDCAGKFSTLLSLEERNCIYCKKNFLCKKISNQRFCSAECFNKYQKDFCTIETRNRSRERTLKMLQDGIFSSVNTKPQRIINRLLLSLNIPFINEYSIKKFSVDNFLYEHNLMIEIQGDYYHCNPLFYDSPINDVQVRRICSDRNKMFFVYDNYRIFILYLWEHDIIKNIEKCKKIIELYLSCRGNIPEYHSYNWNYENGVLSVNKNRVIPFQENELLVRNII